MPLTKRNAVNRELEFYELDDNLQFVEDKAAEAVAARDAAILFSKIFDSTALGLAGTTSGQYFAVPGTGAVYLNLYRNDAGVATFITSIGTFLGGTLTGALNEAPPVTIASAATVDIGAAASNTVIVSGTAAITALGTIAAGAIRHIRATGAFTLTHNATSLILYGSNIVAAVGEGFWFESLGAGNWRLVGRHYVGRIAQTAAANTFANGQTIQSSDAGAAEVLGLIFDRASASPAVSDYLLSLGFRGRTAAAGVIDFAKIVPRIVNIGAGTEAASLDLLTCLAGAMGYCATFGAGVQIGSPTGGDLGRGTINATGLSVNNSAVLKQADIFVSADQTITLAGALTLAHGLGVAPRLWSVVYVCTTAELGYSIGDVVSTGSAQMPAIWPDATNLNVRYASAAVSICHKTTGALTAITSENWKARFLALK